MVETLVNIKFLFFSGWENSSTTTTGPACNWLSCCNRQLPINPAAPVTIIIHVQNKGNIIKDLSPTL